MGLKAPEKFGNYVRGNLREDSVSEWWGGQKPPHCSKLRGKEIPGKVFWEKRKTDVYLESERQEPVQMRD